MECLLNQKGNRKMSEQKRLDSQIRFVLEIDRLKEIQRRSYLLESRRRENSSEHSWHIAVMAMVLAEHGPRGLDLFKVLAMLLVHDLVEIDAGDTYCYDRVGAEDKAQREEEAAARIFGLLPRDQEQWMRSLWEEFEAGETGEARFAHAVDRLMPLLHNFHTQGKSWLEHSISREEVQDRMRPVSQGSEVLAELAREIIDQAVAKGYLRSNGDSKP
jgi:putative hydrolase of HD superfamily